MTFQEFTYIFIPQLAYSYQCGDLPLCVFFDHKLWMDLFPLSPDWQQTPGEFLWQRMRFTAHILEDDTLLIVYELPTPSRIGEDKYLGIRVDRKQHDVVVYTLRRPRLLSNPWEIHQLALPEGKAVFHSVMPSTEWEREDFCHAVNRIPFESESKQTKSASWIERFFQKLVDSQD